MRKVFTKKLEKHENQSFLHISRNDGSIKVGETYSFIEFGTKEFIRNAVCVSSREMYLNQITPEISYLAENCSPEILGLIIDSRKWNDDNLILSVFTDEKELLKTPIKGEYFVQSEGMIRPDELLLVSTFTQKGNIPELVKKTIEEYQNEHYTENKIKISKR